VVVSAVTSALFVRSADELADLARCSALAIAGAGASGQLAERLGCRFLAADPVSAAASVSAEAGAP
jgi:hypothetical protein